MKGRSSLPNDPKIIVGICSGAFWICNRGVVAGEGQEEPLPLQFFRNRQVVGNFNVSLENVRIFLLVEIKVLNLIGKSLNLAPYSRGVMTPLICN